MGFQFDPIPDGRNKYWARIGTMKVEVGSLEVEILRFLSRHPNTYFKIGDIQRAVPGAATTQFGNLARKLAPYIKYKRKKWIVYRKDETGKQRE